MNPNELPEDYDGPLCMVQLEVGLQIPVRGTFEEVDAQAQDPQRTHFSLVGLNGKPVGLSKRNTVIYAPAEVTKPSPIEVPRPQLMVPGSFSQ